MHNCVAALQNCQFIKLLTDLVQGGRRFGSFQLQVARQRLQAACGRRDELPVVVGRTTWQAEADYSAQCMLELQFRCSRGPKMFLGTDCDLHPCTASTTR